MERVIKRLGRVAFEPTFEAMKTFTDHRGEDTVDEIWLLEHPPVFTLGLAGKESHLLVQSDDIPLVRTDRGGQITYHGPGQLVAYLMIDFKRMHIGVRELVRRVEQSVIDLMAEYGIEAAGDVDAPGVYVAGAKIASLGLRIRNGAVYHGLSLNVDMDLSPFDRINPCGYAGLRVTRLKDLGVDETVAQVGERLLPHLARNLAVTQKEQA